LRFIYLDEAGTSDALTSTVRIVAGVVVEADSQIRKMESELKLLKKMTPIGQAEDLFVHAKEIMNNKRWDSVWPLPDRTNFLVEVMKIPRRVGAAVVYGIARRSEEVDFQPPEGWNRSEYEHFLALSQCIAEADEYVRKYAAATEVASLIYEDFPERRRHIRTSLDIARRLKKIRSLDGRVLTAREATWVPHTVMHSNRIRDGVLFQNKRESSFLQFADCCAYGFSRFFEYRKNGERFYEALTGRSVDTIASNIRGAWIGRASFFNHPRQDDPFVEAQHPSLN
jgi:hypothetical protein